MTPPPPLTRLCRDCGQAAPEAPQCPNCTGLRFIAHTELEALSIAHMDCDAFFCSIEKRDNPALRDRPIVVGGGRRGVVAAACYHARIYGVRSAMPMFQALKACPELTVVKGRMEQYSRAGTHIRQMMRELTPLIEPLSIDEAFLDLSGTQRLHGCSPAQSLIRLQNRVLAEVGVTVSIGLSYNKFLAKTASDLDKPNGFAVLGRADAVAFLSDKPVDFIYGIGPSFAAKLKQAGLHKISDVRLRSDKEMAKMFGEAGLRLARLARGEDHRRVNPLRDRKSISNETTFRTDLSELEALKDKLWQMCCKSSARAKAQHLAGRVVTLKLKTAGFKTITRRRSLSHPIQLADALFTALTPLLETETTKNPNQYRLIGAGLSDLCAPQGDVTDMLEVQAAKRGAAERASDKARAKFGPDAITTGRGLRVKKAASKRPNPEKPAKPPKS